jgi:hypothetical protein
MLRVKSRIAFLRVLRNMFFESQPSPGVDVMLTILGDFCQFSAKKWRFFQKKCYYKFFTKTSSSVIKNANFCAKFFGENIFKIITSAAECILMLYVDQCYDFLNIFDGKFSEKIGVFDSI